MSRSPVTLSRARRNASQGVENGDSDGETVEMRERYPSRYPFVLPRG
jgi:hypothetical protein